MIHRTQITASAGNVEATTLELQIFKLNQEPSVTEVDWADQYLAALPVVVSLDDKPVATWQTPDGRWWRKAGHILVSPSSDGPRRFRIWLRVGATDADLRWLERRANEAKAGSFIRSGWGEIESRPGIFKFTALMQCHAPTAATKPSSKYVIPCDEPRCESFSDIDGFHLVKSLDDPAEVILHWLREDSADSPVRFFRFSNSSEWQATVESDDEMDANNLAKHINDLQWALVDMRKLNAAAAA
ncbi:MAG: hypothetical protein ACOH14_07730 [Rhodoglobus sp.]